MSGWLSRGALRVLCLAAVTGTGTLAAGAPPAVAAPGGPFNPASPSVFISQGSPTQLEQAVESNGQLVFQNVGPAAAFHYNGLAYDSANNYLYAVVIAGRPGAGEVVQIDSSGHATSTGVNVGSVSQYEDSGVFDGANGNLYFGSSAAGAKTLFVDNPATGVTSTLALSSAPRAADYAFAQGYLWGIGSAGIVRINPATGTVSDFPIPSGLLPGAPNTIFGAAWTYGNGNLGFSNNSSGGIYQIAITSASSANPSFSLISNQPGPANSINDGASIPGLPADLALTKSASPTAVASGGQITYTLTVTNNGPGNSSGYVLDDPLPAVLGNLTTTTPGCAISAYDLTCQGNPLAVGGSATITVTGTAPTPDTAAITNTATVTGNEQDPNLANNTASATVQPQSADLAIAKSASSAIVTAGGQVTYTLLVTNNGPADASNVSVSDALPADESLVSAVPLQGSCSGTRCQLGSLAAGGQTQVLLTVNVAAGAAGSITNTASVSATTPDPNPANNTSSSTISVTPQSATGTGPAPGPTPTPAPGPTPTPAPIPAPSPIPTPRSTQPVSDLQILKRVDHARARPGQLLTYTLLVTNHGPDSAAGVVVTDTPQIPLVDVHTTPSQGSCAGGRPLRCSLGTLKTGATARIVVTGKVLRTGTEVNAASVTSTSTDPNPGNNISRARTSIVAPAPMLRLRKTASPTRISAGGTVSYRLTVTATHEPARGIRVCDALPLGLTFLSANPAAALSNGRECWTIHRLLAGHSRTIVLRARALPSTRGTLVNHASAQAAGTRTVHARAKVLVTRSAASALPPAGGVTG